MGKYDQYKESVFTHEEMQPMIIETDMTDIVEQLRGKVPMVWEDEGFMVVDEDAVLATFTEAADEIERLRTENQELKLQYLSDQGQWIEETGRLREALYVISTHPVEQSKQWEIGAREMQKLARLSLEEEWGGRFNKMAQALGYFLAIDEDSQSSWKYGREEAAKLARAALGEKE